jgi:hypothetical protein
MEVRGMRKICRLHGNSEQLQVPVTAFLTSGYSAIHASTFSTRSPFGRKNQMFKRCFLCSLRIHICDTIEEMHALVTEEEIIWDVLDEEQRTIWIWDYCVACVTIGMMHELEAVKRHLSETEGFGNE